MILVKMYFDRILNIKKTFRIVALLTACLCPGDIFERKYFNTITVFNNAVTHI